MIIRNKRISKFADEVQLCVSYTSVDIKKMVQWLFRCYYHKDCKWLIPQELATPHTEQDIIELFQCDPKCFANYQDKWSRLLSEWAFNISLKEGFIQKSATTENAYFFSPKCVQKKRGRPSKKDLYDE